MGLADDQKFRDGMEAILNEIAAETPAPEFHAAAENLIQTIDRFIEDPTQGETQIKADYTALYSISGTPGEALLHKMMNLVKTGQDGHFTLNDHIESKKKDDEAYSRQFKTALQAIIAQGNTAEMIRRFDTAMDGIDDDLNGPNGFKAQFAAHVFADRTRRESFEIESKKFAERFGAQFDKALEAAEASAADPNNAEKRQASTEALQEANIELEQYRSLIDDILQKEEYAKIQKQEMAQNLERSLLRMGSIVENIIDPQAREMAKGIIDNVADIRNASSADAKRLAEEQIKKQIQELKAYIQTLQKESPEREQLERFMKAGMELQTLREQTLQQIEEHNRVMRELGELRELVTNVLDGTGEALNMSPQERLQRLRELKPQVEELENASNNIRLTIDETEAKRLDIVVGIWNEAAKRGDISWGSSAKDLAQRLGLGSIANEVVSFDTYNKSIDVDIDGDGILDGKNNVYRADSTGLYYVLNLDNSRTYLPGKEQMRLQREDNRTNPEASPQQVAYYGSFANEKFPDTNGIKLAGSFGTAVANTAGTGSAEPAKPNSQPVYESAPVA